MRLPSELRRLLHLDRVEGERPDDRARRERLERQEVRHRRALEHAEEVIAEVRRAQQLIEGHRG
ncbi:MAG TPA: hypothetical protein VFC31_13020 [Candidatus Limnocylindria bacterium]|nr:hypothetical protein [Candidatus Limnocylindria bacterium]